MTSSLIPVILIDLLVDFFEQQPVLAQQRTALVACVNELTDEARRHGHPVVWVRQEFQPDLSDAFLNMRRDCIQITIAGTPGSQILPELVRGVDDLVVIKKRYSAFFGTELESLLVAFQPRALIVAGINTHACVRMTAVDAFQRDYEVLIAEECTSSFDAEHHRVTLQYFDRGIARRMRNADLAALFGGSTT